MRLAQAIGPWRLAEIRPLQVPLSMERRHDPGGAINRMVLFNLLISFHEMELVASCH